MNTIWREVFDILSPYSFHLKCGSAHDARRRLLPANSNELYLPTHTFLKELRGPSRTGSEFSHDKSWLQAPAEQRDGGEEREREMPRAAP